MTDYRYDCCNGYGSHGTFCSRFPSSKQRQAEVIHKAKKAAEDRREIEEIRRNL